MTRTIGGETGNGVGLRTRCGARHGDGRAGTGTNRGGKGAGSGRIGKGKLPRDVVRIRRTATSAGCCGNGERTNRILRQWIGNRNRHNRAIGNGLSTTWRNRWGAIGIP